MGGRLSRAIDRTGRWERECTALEDRLGFAPGVLYEDWQITADLRELKSVVRMPREIHEEMAYRDLLALWDKQGATLDVAN